MRHVTQELDLDKLSIINVNNALATTRRRKPLADLPSVAVYVLEADASGRDVAQWEPLKKFWAAYLNERTCWGRSVFYAPKVEP